MILITIENSNVIIIQYYLVSKLEMHSYSQGFYPYSGPKMQETASTYHLIDSDGSANRRLTI